ncbi:TPR repeat-containing protein [Magnetococcus marinus MC-1]|uniref:TPR repeat-containing protein n=1 Tax=Magnetococcus marinus (strain ATCC BAA-1437 / JCM 17883 / MC-1) TaxID=156889 RepID=A0L836_MAGMM|nr:c-type cytochrome biogenesis protein CcmI [Magnetococcus marinus]ABK44129.1 TPR repeat-containing protein [Magnetococcus marinus MC-1]
MTLWLIIIPILSVALFMVFVPLFRANGNRPLPVGLEGNPLVELQDRRDILLRQLKELEMDTQGGLVDADDAANNRKGMEEELGEILTKLDALEKPAQTAPQSASDAQRSQANLSVSRAMGVAVIVLVSTSSVMAYQLLSTADREILAEQAPQEQEGGPMQGQQAPDIGAMVARLEERLKSEPDNIDGWLMLGRSLRNMDRTMDAINAYKHVLERQPDHVDAAVGMAITLLETEDRAQMGVGIKLLESIHKKQPEQLDTLWLLGMGSYQLGAYEAAVKWLDKLLPLAPEDVKAQVQKAIDMAKQKLQAQKG